MSLRQHFSIITGQASTNISTVASDGERGWTPYYGALGNHITEEGELILDLLDISEDGTFVESGILDRWASASGFSLEDIDPWAAFYMLATRTLREFVDSIDEDDPRRPYIDATVSGSPLTDERFLIKINQTFLVSLLVESFDGPFGVREPFYDAIARRFGFDSWVL